MNITEQQLETATIDWFGELGWHYANGLDIAPDGEQLTSLVSELSPDVAIIDIRMPPSFTYEGARVAVELRTARGTPAYDDLEYALFLVFNAGDALTVTLPPVPAGQRWVFEATSSQPRRGSMGIKGKSVKITDHSVAIFVLETIA